MKTNSEYFEMLVQNYFRDSGCTGEVEIYKINYDDWLEIVIKTNFGDIMFQDLLGYMYKKSLRK